LALSDKLIYHSSIIKLRSHDPNNMKELDISKTLNNKIQEILEEGSSESQKL